MMTDPTCALSLAPHIQLLHMKKIILLLCFLPAATGSLGQAGSLDPAFCYGGFVRTDLNGSSFTETPFKLRLGADGRLHTYAWTDQSYFPVVSADYTSGGVLHQFHYDYNGYEFDGLHYGF